MISTVAKGAKTITQFGAKALKFYDNPVTQMAITAYQTHGDPMSIAMAGAGLTGSLTGKMRNSQKLAGLITKAPKTVQKFANATGKVYDKVSGLGTKLNNKINAMAEKSQNAISNFFGKAKNKLGDKLSDLGMKARSFGVKYAEVPRLAMPGGGSIGRPVKVPVGVGINQTKLDNLRQIKANKAANLNARSVANKADDVAEDLARSASRNKSSQLNHTTSEAGNHQGAGKPGQTHKELENDLNRKKVADVDKSHTKTAQESGSNKVHQTEQELKHDVEKTREHIKVDSSFDNFDSKTATSIQKGNFGENVTHAELMNMRTITIDGETYNLDLERISVKDVATLGTPTAKGIDGIYKNGTPLPYYIINESKFGKSGLKNTKTMGRQMSAKWIETNLLKELGEDNPLVGDIMKSLQSGKSLPLLSKIDAEGNVTFKQLNKSGYITQTLK